MLMEKNFLIILFISSYIGITFFQKRCIIAGFWGECCVFGFPNAEKVGLHQFWSAPPLQALVVLDYKLIIDRRTPADV